MSATRSSALRSTAASRLRHRRAAGRSEFIDSRADLVDRSLAFIYGLLVLSIMIAMFGIVLTLLLAVYERRREIGLLRAVGMTRAQVRTTVRWESVITSVYGAVVGVVMGLVLGYVVIVALRDQGLTKYSVPVPTIVGILVSPSWSVSSRPWSRRGGRRNSTSSERSPQNDVDAAVSPTCWRSSPNAIWRR